MYLIEDRDGYRLPTLADVFHEQALVVALPDVLQNSLCCRNRAQQITACDCTQGNESLEWSPLASISVSHSLSFTLTFKQAESRQERHN